MKPDYSAARFALSVFSIVAGVFALTFVLTCVFEPDGEGKEGGHSTHAAHETTSSHGSTDTHSTEKTHSAPEKH